MRKTIIAIIILLIALSFLTIGIMTGQLFLLEPFYEEMAEIE
ncbi:MAG: hypothetical protein ACFFAO_00990 [Candidatus Hermodarchaeota archaeon]